MQRIDVEAGRPYPVLIGRGLLYQAGQIAAKLSSLGLLALIVDEHVAEHYSKQVTQSFQQVGYRVIEYRFAPGECAKSMERLSSLLEFLAENGFSKSDRIAALGGGVTGDLAGFAAAVYQRGIPYIQLLTSLLAAVDSSVGGKTAVNLSAGKNLAGAFWQPEVVICDCDTFATLPREELISGAAECLKYAMLGDEALLRRMTREGLDLAWEGIVASCVRQKAELVRQDEQDSGVRQLLNFGHTVGHAVENLSGYTVRHGDAVAIGMLVITCAAQRMAICGSGTAEQLREALQALDLPVRCPYSAEELAQAALGDKKRRGDQITLILPRKIGECMLYPVKTSALASIIQMGLEA